MFAGRPGRTQPPPDPPRTPTTTELGIICSLLKASLQQQKITDQQTLDYFSVLLYQGRVAMESHGGAKQPPNLIHAANKKPTEMSPGAVLHLMTHHLD